MTASRAEAGAARGTSLRRGRLFGFLLVAVLAVICAMPRVPGLETLRLSWFDVCQRAAPRARVSGPVVIVDVDGRSLATHGQWPWPRTLLAQLFDRIAAGGPAAIGLDVLMPEPDRLSPQRLPALVPHHRSRPRGAARRAAEQRRGAGGGDPRTTGGAGHRRRGSRLRARVAAARPDGSRAVGGRRPHPVSPALRLDAAQAWTDVDYAAAGHGLLNADPEGGAVRRVPLVAAVGGVMIPTLALEMFRVAAGVPGFTVKVGDGGIERIGVDTFVVPTQPDGSVWLRYTGRTPARFVSAADVLAGTVPRERVRAQARAGRRHRARACPIAAPSPAARRWTASRFTPS